MLDVKGKRKTSPRHISLFFFGTGHTLQFRTLDSLAGSAQDVSGSDTEEMGRGGAIDRQYSI